MIALMTNFVAFYLAALLFERTGILSAVTFFLVTALAGTIIASMIEECLRSLLSRGFNAHGKSGAGRSAVITPLP